MNKDRRGIKEAEHLLQKSLERGDHHGVNYYSDQLEWHKERLAQRAKNRKKNKKQFKKANGFV